MHTLQDFLLVTKAETYLIAVGLLLVFPLFWRWLNGSRVDRKTNATHNLRPSGRRTRPAD